MKTAPARNAGAKGLRVALLRGAFNASVVDGLADGARLALREMGARDGDVVDLEVPGAFELPLAALVAARSGRFDAVIALGCVIRGATPHFEYVAGAAANGAAAVGAAVSIPVVFGVLTTETIEQAIERAGTKHGNKGWEAAMAALEMARLSKSIG